jgi:hypothetical protein
LKSGVNSLKKVPKDEIKDVSGPDLTKEKKGGNGGGNGGGGGGGDMFAQMLQQRLKMNKKNE